MATDCTVPRNKSRCLHTVNSGSEIEKEPNKKSEFIKIQEQEERNLKSHKDDLEERQDVKCTTTKTKLQKVEWKLVPLLEKLSAKELMETNTYQQFTRSLLLFLENVENLDELDDETEVTILKCHLQDLCSGAAKLKVLGAMELVPVDRLFRLLTVLERNVRDGISVSPVADPNDNEDESRMWINLTMKRVIRAADASLTSLYILTSPNMPKKLYLEDVIDRIIIFTKYQLENTIYPSFDPVHKMHPKADLGGRKKCAKEVRDKGMLSLYNKLHESVGLLTELITVQVLTDTAILHASSMAVSPFFIENVHQLQLSSLKLVTMIFAKYEKHRWLLLDDVLSSLARVPLSKRSLQSYKISSGEHIQMFTALVLQLMQCVVALPERLQTGRSEEDKENEDENKIILLSDDCDDVVLQKYESVCKLAASFLSELLRKCISKMEGIDYRPVFDNFVQDLLKTVNTPEWPVAELLLSLLGKLLASKFVNKGTDTALRVASLDYLGVVAARLRKDADLSHAKLNRIDEIISEIKAAEQKEMENSGTTADKRYGETEEERIQFLQRVLLDYLAVNGQSDQVLLHTRHFYLAQWYWDADAERKHVSTGGKLPHDKIIIMKKKLGKKRKDENSNEASPACSEEDGSRMPRRLSTGETALFYRLIDIRKRFLLSKIRPFQDNVGVGNKSRYLQTYIDYESVELVSQYLASKRSFSNSFDGYLQRILFVLTESCIALRTKAMKCLAMVVEADPAILGRDDVQRCVRHSFLDQSTSVREAAVDIVGKFILSRPELVESYYEMLSERILDIGVSVRKRVIKILKDICVECPNFPKIPEICVKMICRINDEEGVRKLVIEIFQNMWFTPVGESLSRDSPALLKKVVNITDAVAASQDMGFECFEQLLINIFKPKGDRDNSARINAEPARRLLTASKQIVDCLIERVLRLEQKCASSQHLVACFIALSLFAKIQPQLLVDHATTLQPYLSLKCQTRREYQMISSVARTLELVVPLMEHPSEPFFAQLEEDLVKLVLQHDRMIVSSCLSCLGSVVNSVTRNFKLVRDCFLKYYGFLLDYKRKYEEDPTHLVLVRSRPFFRRALFTVGLLLRHFDFTDKCVFEGLDEDIKDQVCDTLTYFMQQGDEDVQLFTLKAVGSLCVRHYEFMLGAELKLLYHRLLTEETAPLHMRTQVLNNIEIYLQEEEKRMMKQDKEWAKLSKQENLKELGDVTSGMASTVIQLYLKQILESCFHLDVGVRRSVFRVVQLVLQQGLVHPVQIVPYLICMSTDTEKAISHSADKQLQEIDKKYPGFIHMKAQSGIKLSYRLQNILQAHDSEIVRGYRVQERGCRSALNGFLYSILRNTKQQRRAVVLSILKQFDEQAKTSLSQMLYLSDNLAYFPYQVQDEPLFIIHQIDIMISVSGTNLLQLFRDSLRPNTSTDQEAGGTEVEEEDEDDEEVLLGNLPDDIATLQECIAASQGCVLLLVLRQHLKDLHGIRDARIAQYSPSESSKAYEKSLNHCSNSQFDPKATLHKLQHNSGADVSDESERRTLVAQYLDFRQLMLKFDPVDSSDDGSGETQKVTVKYGEELRSSSASEVGGRETLIADRSQRNTQSERTEAEEVPCKMPKLTVRLPQHLKVRDSRKNQSYNNHKTNRHKNRRHKRSLEDSGDEYNDPNFIL